MSLLYYLLKNRLLRKFDFLNQFLLSKKIYFRKIDENKYLKLELILTEFRNYFDSQSQLEIFNSF